MKSFLATSNNQYIQTGLALREGSYTFSALVRSVSTNYAFALKIGGVWTRFELPTDTTRWRKLTHTFYANGLITEFNIIADYASPTSEIEVLQPMFEEGTFASTPRLHELDIMEVISNAKLEAENAAKAYSDAELNAREVTIKAYADGKVDAEEARAIADAQAKVDALALVEEQARLALQTTMESYADGVVDAEEQARIDDVNTKLAAAKAYADSVSNLARTNAEAYADGKVDAEEARAIADATQKMNEAKAHAESIGLTIQNQVDNIGIRITAEEQKVVDLENKTGAFAQPSTNPAENTLLAGSMLVGNSSGTNAGISGLGTSGSSVRLWAGETFANRATSDWLMREDGVEEQWFNGVKVRERGVIGGNYVDRFFNPIDGLMAKQTAIVNGYITEQWYNNGLLVYQIGKGGIYYVSEVPESYQAGELLQVSTSTSTTIDSLLLSSIGDGIYAKLEARDNGTIVSFGKLPYNPSYVYSIIGTSTKQLYQAGQNVYSQSNAQYEGWKNTTDKFDNITDGWWYEYTGSILTYAGSQGGSESLMFLVQRIISGKVTHSARVLVHNQMDYELLT